ncbi:MAG: hypothetical protein ACE14S_06985 [Candidatus Bathyarchaeia archaeon]
MNVAVKALEIVTSIIWVLLIVVVALAAFAVQDLAFEVYKPTASLSQSGSAVFPMRVNVNNLGGSDMKAVTVTAVLYGANDTELAGVSSLANIVPARRNATVLQNLTVTGDALARNDARWLFEDRNCTIGVSVGSTFGQVLPAELSANVSSFWGAPFFNFSLAKPVVAAFNSTHEGVAFSLSFVNHASSTVAGNFTTDLFDQNGVFRGRSQVSFDLERFAPFADNLQFYVPAPTSALEKGYVEFQLSSSFCDYGPWVVPFG